MTKFPHSKKCAFCHLEKDLNNYCKDKHNKDGLYNYCRDCRAIKSKENYEKNRNSLISRRKTFKEGLLSKFGSCCKHCGYNRCLAGLEFHHIGNKKFQISKLINSLFRKEGNTVEVLENELTKCILLCSNCHRELHAGCWRLE